MRVTPTYAATQFDSQSCGGQLLVSFSALKTMWASTTTKGTLVACDCHVAQTRLGQRDRDILTFVRMLYDLETTLFGRASIGLSQL